MTQKNQISVDFDLFSANRYGETVVLEFKENLIVRLTDLKAKTAALEYLSTLSGDRSLKAVVVMAPKDKCGREEYLDFFTRIQASRLDRSALLRMLNGVNQFVLELAEIDKVTLHVIRGKTMMMFFNIALAADYRIIGENTVIQNPCLELGMIPKGGGAFFLSRMVGVGKAFELMLSCRDLTASEALSLGLVHEVVQENELTDAALAAADRFCQNPLSSLVGVKRLLNYDRKRLLRDFLEYENQELVRIVDSGEFKTACSA